MTRFHIRSLVVSAATLLMLTGLAAPARADLTAFWGFSPTVDTRSTKGVAIGMSSVVFGAEFEYARIAESTPQAAPGLKTYMANGMLITPGRKAQLYVSAGIGRYTETLNSSELTGTATSFGFGIKYRVLGPIKLRGDYRTMSLQGTPLVKRPKRFYFGVTLGL